MSSVREIWRHPVKSMQGERIASGDVLAQGLAGDRRWGVFDPLSGKVLSAKSEGRLLEASAALPDPDGPPVVRLPDGTECEAGDPALDHAISEWLGRALLVRKAAEDASTPWEFRMDELVVDGGDDALVQLETPPGNLYDLGPVHLLTTSSLAAAAAEHPDGRWDVRRFRPQFVIDTGAAEGYVENEWVGAGLRIGEAEFEGMMPTVRCVMTTRVQDGLPRDLEIWKTLKRTNGYNLGLYATITAPGRVREGDPVSVVPVSSS